MEWYLTSPRTELRNCGGGGSAEEAWCELAEVAAPGLNEIGMCSLFSSYTRADCRTSEAGRSLGCFEEVGALGEEAWSNPRPC
jgi:hypothetical protein